ncbi:MAG: YdcF family protein [Oscillospiraceae bacterium]
MEKLLQDITDFVFKKDAPQKCDIIFVTGGSFPEQGERAAQLYKEGFAPLIMPSGKYSVHNGKFNGALSKKEQYPFASETESEFLSCVMQQNNVPQTAILCEKEAVSTYDNARFSAKMLNELNINVRSAILCCKSMHARRAFMYYQYYFPETQIFVCPVDILNVTCYNWHKTPQGIGIVMSELEKCGKQFAPMLCDILCEETTDKSELLRFF